MNIDFFSLSQDARTSLLNAVHALSTLGTYSEGQHRTATTPFLDTINVSLLSIQIETANWNNKLYEIIHSEIPSGYFDEESAHVLVDADAFSRSAEEMLRIQSEATFNSKDIKLATDVLSVIGQLKVAVFKLRKSIENVIKLEMRMQGAESVDEASFDAMADALISVRKSKTPTVLH
ncbi:hypothetical protein [Enterovibrio norvegicus]|uniref:hypothetical protein n=1 Tax=Enterovibrio norvegicus TaxID=188144 RepID=UPI00355456FF